MPRDAVAITDITTAGVNTPAGTAINAANGGNIAGPHSSRVGIRVTNTFAGTKVVTFAASTDNPPGVRAPIGDLAVTVPASTGDMLFWLETARFVKADGSIDVNYAASMTGQISAFRLPKGA